MLPFESCSHLHLTSTGVMYASNGYAENLDHMVPFEEFYDRPLVESALKKIGIEVATKGEEQRVLLSRHNMTSRLSLKRLTGK